jgi:hypothetical protein
LNGRHGFFVQKFISREKAKAAAPTLPPLPRVIISHVVGNEILIGVPALISDWVCVYTSAHCLARSFAQPFSLSLSSLFIKEIFHPHADEKLNRINSDFIFSARFPVVPRTQMRCRLNLIIAGAGSSLAKLRTCRFSSRIGRIPEN